MINVMLVLEDVGPEYEEMEAGYFESQMAICCSGVANCM